MAETDIVKPKDAEKEADKHPEPEELPNNKKKDENNADVVDNEEPQKGTFREALAKFLSRVTFLSSFIACHQPMTLLPVCTLCAEIVICLDFVFLMIFNFIIFVVGIIFVRVMTRYNTSYLIKIVHPTSNLSEIVEKRLDTFSQVTAPELQVVGIRFLCLGIFSLIFLTILMVVLFKRLQILVLLFMGIFFIMGITYVAIGFGLLGYLGHHISSILFLLLFNDFEASRCYHCSVKVVKNDTYPNIQLFEEVLMIAAKKFKCCGIDSAKDYLKYNENEIPPICCGINLTVTHSNEACQPTKAFRGCLEAIKDRIRSSPYFDYVRLLLVFIGLMMLLIVVILALETVAFLMKMVYLQCLRQKLNTFS